MIQNKGSTIEIRSHTRMGGGEEIYGNLLPLYLVWT